MPPTWTTGGAGVNEPNTTMLAGWLDRMKAGDPAARNELVTAVTRRMAELTGRMLLKYPTVRANVEADDVFQNACLRLLRALDEVTPATTRDFFALAAVQIRRELLDLARYYRTPGRRFAPTPDSTDSPAPDWSPPAAPPADDLERWGRFHAAVERLPVEEREVVGLRFYHGWPEADIAGLLGVSERTVQRYWKSALARLKADVGDP